MSSKKHKARQLALQGLYQWQVTAQDPDDIIKQFVADENSRTFDVAYFPDLLTGVVLNLDDIDSRLSPLLNRGIEQVDMVERAILRLGVYEFLFHPEIPYRVVINEAVELAKVFGAEQGHRYVNGILDKLSASLRPLETKAT
jgi:N utilization substance protein B